MRIVSVAVVGLALFLAACGRDPGPQGPAGPVGPQGPVGAQGPAGPQGIQGVTGAQGAQGPQGAAGPKGDKGDKGDAGVAGSANLRMVRSDGAVACSEGETLASVFCPSGGAADGAKCVTPPAVGLCIRNP